MTKAVMTFEVHRIVYTPATPEQLRNYFWSIYDRHGGTYLWRELESWGMVTKEEADGMIRSARLRRRLLSAKARLKRGRHSLDGAL